MRLIDAHALTKDLENILHEVPGNKPSAKIIRSALRALIGLVKDAPTVKTPAGRHKPSMYPECAGCSSCEDTYYDAQEGIQAAQTYVGKNRGCYKRCPNCGEVIE